MLKLFGQGLSRVCLEGKAPGKRSVGRPRMRWMDNVHKWSGLTTNELKKASRDRPGWRRVSSVGAQSALGRANDQ